jgi:hypothetical protein
VTLDRVCDEENLCDTTAKFASISGGAFVLVSSTFSVANKWLVVISTTSATQIAITSCTFTGVAQQYAVFENTAQLALTGCTFENIMFLFSFFCAKYSFFFYTEIRSSWDVFSLMVSLIRSFYFLFCNFCNFVHFCSRIHSYLCFFYSGFALAVKNCSEFALANGVFSNITAGTIASGGGTTTTTGFAAPLYISDGSRFLLSFFSFSFFVSFFLLQFFFCFPSHLLILFISLVFSSKHYFFVLFTQW